MADPQIKPQMAAEGFPALASMGHGTRGRLSALVALLDSGGLPGRPENCRSLPEVANGSTNLPTAAAPTQFTGAGIPSKQGITDTEAQKAGAYTIMGARSPAVAHVKQVMRNGGGTGHRSRCRHGTPSVRQESQSRNDALSTSYAGPSGLHGPLQCSGCVPASTRHCDLSHATSAICYNDVDQREESTSADLNLRVYKAIPADVAGPSKRVTRASRRCNSPTLMARQVERHSIDAVHVVQSRLRAGLKASHCRKRKRAATDLPVGCAPVPASGVAHGGDRIKCARVARAVALKRNSRLEFNPLKTRTPDDAEQACYTVNMQDTRSYLGDCMLQTVVDVTCLCRQGITLGAVLTCQFLDLQQPCAPMLVCRRLLRIMVLKDPAIRPNMKTRIAKLVH